MTKQIINLCNGLRRWNRNGETDFALDLKHSVEALASDDDKTSVDIPTQTADAFDQAVIGTQGSPLNSPRH